MKVYVINNIHDQGIRLLEVVETNEPGVVAFYGNDGGIRYYKQWFMTEIEARRQASQTLKESLDFFEKAIDRARKTMEKLNLGESA